MALALVACQPVTPVFSPLATDSTAQPDYSITLTGQSGLVRAVGINDPGDLLAAGPQPLLVPPHMGGFTVEREPANPRAVDVRWEGGCGVDLLLTITQSGTELLFDLFPGHAPATCAPAGYLFGMRVTFEDSTEELDLVTHLQPLVLESEAPG